MAIMQAAAPEVVHAAESANPLVEASTATDIWALGVVAYELLTSGHVFPLGTPQEAIRAAIFGIEAMPWEESSESEELSPLQVRLPGPRSAGRRSSSLHLPALAALAHASRPVPSRGRCHDGRCS